jgi:hypothetical protein
MRLETLEKLSLDNGILNDTISFVELLHNGRRYRIGGKTYEEKAYENYKN